jgi:hypothetical protein
MYKDLTLAFERLVDIIKDELLICWAENYKGV